MYVDPRECQWQGVGEKKGRQKGKMYGRDAHESSSSAKVWNQLWRRDSRSVGGNINGFLAAEEGRRGMG